MKPNNNIGRAIVRTIVIAIVFLGFTGLLGYCSKDLLIGNTGKTEVPIDTERYVIPIKKNIFKESLSQIGEVSSVSDGMELRLPSSAGDKIAADQIRENIQSFGISIRHEEETLVLTMSKGPGSTILVPVPTFVALVDRGIIKASRK